MPIPPSVILGAASLGSSLISNRGSKRSQRRANKYNVRFWNMQNEYNSPTSQMARLREAGLNPNLIYGQSVSGATGLAEKIAPSKAEPYDIANPLQNITQFADIKKSQAQTDNLKQLSTVIIQDEQLRKGQSEGQKIKNRFAPALAGTSLQVQQAQVNQMYQRTIGQKIDNMVNDATKAKQIQIIGQTLLNAKETLTGIELSNSIKEFEKTLNAVGLTKTDSAIIRAMYMNYGKLKKKNKKQLDNPRLDWVNPNKHN